MHNPCICFIMSIFVNMKTPCVSYISGHCLSLFNCTFYFIGPNFLYFTHFLLLQMGKKREREWITSSTCSLPNACKLWVRIRLKLRGRRSILTFCNGGRDLIPRSASAIVGQKRSNKASYWYSDMRCWHSTTWLNPLSQNTYPFLLLLQLFCLK